jgi:SAM-dependent methyltransferase
MSKAQPETPGRMFDSYAQYYDLLYKEKDYAGEARFVHEQLLRQGGGAGSLLELGCGTGRHAVEFVRLGQSVTGVDLSPLMVEQAKARAAVLSSPAGNNLMYDVGDVRSVRLPHKFDGVASLFHVMSYQTTDADLLAACRTAAYHLNLGGVFFFDFWYGPAVKHDPPQVRVKRLEDDSIHVTRIAEPIHEPSRHIVTVNYDIFLRTKSDGLLEEIREEHPMRYLFIPELTGILECTGFEVRDAGAWMSDQPPSSESWYAWLVAKLIRE